MDVAEAKTKMAEDLLAQERVSLKKKLEDGEDELVDTTMYRTWSQNLNLNLSFLASEVERVLDGKFAWKKRKIFSLAARLPSEMSPGMK